MPDPAPKTPPRPTATPGCAGDTSARKNVALPVLNGGPAAGTPEKGRGPRKSRMAKWRAAVLIGVHALIAAHIVKWLVFGSTLSPVEPSESMYALELGQVNAGFIFFAVALLLTLVFGRFVCGWACHVVALQDLCAHAMTKLGVRPRPFRSRLLLWVPLLIALYMFVWPTFKRELLAPAFDRWWPEGLLYIGAVQPFPGFSNHLVTTDFWKTFPPVHVAIPFLIVCGFATVYFLGAKGFCTYACPYGGFFAPVSRLAPGRIVVDLDTCEKCGHCTAACTSNVRVHEEIQVYGGVVDPGCMKCLDCVSVCPTGALSFSFAAPAAFAKPLKEPPPRRHDLSWPEEIAVAAVFAFAFFGTRGVYDAVPMLFALGIGGCSAFIAWKSWRLFLDRDVRIIGAQLKRAGRLRPAGGAFIAAAALLFAFIGHSFYLKTQRWIGDHHDSRVAVAREVVLTGAFDRVSPEARDHAARAIERFRRLFSFRHGGHALADTRGDAIRVAWLHMVLGELPEAEANLRRGLARQGPVDGLYADLAQVVTLQGRIDEAIELCRGVLQDNPAFAGTRDMLAGLLLQKSDADGAIAVYERRIAESPDDAAAATRLGELLLLLGRTDEGLARLDATRAALPPGAHDARQRLATIYFQLGRIDDARATLASGVEADPDSPQAHAQLGQFLLGVGDAKGALERFDRAVELNKRILHIRRDRAIALHLNGQTDRAVDELRRLGRLDLAGASGYWRLAARMLQESGRVIEGERLYREADERDRRLSRSAG